MVTIDEAAIRPFVDGLIDVSPFESETSAVMQDEPGEDGPDGFTELVGGALRQGVSPMLIAILPGRPSRQRHRMRRS